MKEITIYTDGACKGNPGVGAFAAILSYKGKTKEIYGFEKDTTNNKMELKAVIYALKQLKEKCKVNIYADSQYVQNGITKWIFSWLKNNWKNSKKEAVKNQELWQLLLEETNKHEVSWHWVKGHNGDLGNERADELCNYAIKTKSSNIEFN